MELGHSSALCREGLEQVFLRHLHSRRRSALHPQHPAGKPVWANWHNPGAVLVRALLAAGAHSPGHPIQVPADLLPTHGSGAETTEQHRKVGACRA